MDGPSLWGSSEVLTTHHRKNLIMLRSIHKNVDGKIILKLIFEKWDGGGAWAESIWFRIRTGGELL